MRALLRRALVGGAAGLLAASAWAGIDAWTTTGPRAAWDVVGGDSCANGASIVGAFGRWARSQDAGSHWQILATPPGETVGWADNIPGNFFNPLAVAADRAGSGALFLATSTGALLKSVDGGATWNVLPARIPLDPVGYVFVPYGYEAHVQRLLVDGGRILVVLFNGTLKRSLDGGATLETIGPPGVVVRDADARGSRIVVAGHDTVIPGPPRVWRSDDGGTTWRVDPFVFPVDGYALQVVMGPGDRAVALLFGHTTVTPTLARIWTSDDGGLTFGDSGNAWPTDPYLGSRDPDSKSLRVADCHPELIVLRDRYLARVSSDAGTTWHDVALSPHDNVLGAAWGRPASAGGPPSLMLTTLRLGVVRSVDGGASFVPQNRGLPGAPMTTLDATVLDGNRVAFANAAFRWNFEGGFYDRFGYALIRRGAGDNRWVDASPPLAGAPTFLVSPSEPGTVLAWGRFYAQDLTGYRSVDGGITWIEYGNRVPVRTERVGSGVEDTGRLFAFGSYVFHNNRPDGSTPATLARSVDLGATFAYGAAEYVTTNALAAARSPVTRVYAGRSVFPGDGAAGFHVSNDGGGTWGATPTPAAWTGAFSPIDAIAVDPADGQHVIVAGRFGNRVFETVDGGTTWTPYGAAFPAAQGLALTVQWQRSPRRVLLGTSDGLYALEGTGAGGTAAWSPVGVSAGMQVASVKVEGPPGRETFTVATDRGVFELTQDAAAVTVPVFRFYNVETQTHFYTASVAERDHVLATWPQFLPEGIAFHAVGSARTDAGVPVWRFFNALTGTHFYTASADERAHVLATWPQFVDEGVAYRALPGTDAGTVKLFRFFNTATGAHFYTTEDDERAVVNERLQTFIDEGVAYAVYPAVPAP